MAATSPKGGAWDSILDLIKTSSWSLSGFMSSYCSYNEHKQWKGPNCNLLELCGRGIGEWVKEGQGLVTLVESRIWAGGCFELILFLSPFHNHLTRFGLLIGRA